MGILQQEFCYVYNHTPSFVFRYGEPKQHRFGKCLFNRLFLEGIFCLCPELQVRLNEQQLIACPPEINNLFTAQLPAVEANIIASDPAAQGINV